MPYSVGFAARCCLRFYNLSVLVLVGVKQRSPKHPALFVTANISGELGLWNLNHSMEEPFTPPVKVMYCCGIVGQYVTRVPPANMVFTDAGCTLFRCIHVCAVHRTGVDVDSGIDRYDFKVAIPKSTKCVQQSFEILVCACGDKHVSSRCHSNPADGHHLVLATRSVVQYYFCNALSIPSSRPFLFDTLCIPFCLMMITWCHEPPIRCELCSEDVDAAVWTRLQLRPNLIF